MKKTMCKFQSDRLKIYFKQLMKCLVKGAFFVISLGVVLFSTAIGYLMAQKFKNAPRYYDYMQQCVDGGGEYLSCHQGKGYQK